MHHTVAYEIVVLAVVEHGEIKHPGIFNRSPHQFMILDTVAVVGDCNNAGLYHRSDWRHLFSSQVSGDRTSREYVDTGGLPRSLENPSYSAWIIRRRTGIGH